MGLAELTGCDRMKELPKDKKYSAPLFNLDITLDGWRGPFMEVNSFLGTAKNAIAHENLKGEHYITRDGRINAGKMKGLHTFKADINVALIPTHLELYAPVPTSTGIGSVLSLISPTKVRTEDLPSHAICTLEGLYSTLPDQANRTKLVALVEEFHKRNRLSVDITIPLLGDYSMLERLEKEYQRTISDQ